MEEQTMIDPASLHIEPISVVGTGGCGIRWGRAVCYDVGTLDYPYFTEAEAEAVLERNKRKWIQIAANVLERNKRELGKCT
jgi:hypothetical protein